MKINELSGAHQGKKIAVEGVLSAIQVNPSGYLDVRIQTGGGSINMTVDPQAATSADVSLVETGPDQ